MANSQTQIVSCHHCLSAFTVFTTELMNTHKEYLGDSVYAAFDGFGIVLTNENGLGPSNRIVLEPEVVYNLDRYVERLKARLAANRPVYSFVKFKKPESDRDLFTWGQCPRCECALPCHEEWQKADCKSEFELICPECRTVVTVEADDVTQFKCRLTYPKP